MLYLFLCPQSLLLGLLVLLLSSSPLLCEMVAVSKSQVIPALRVPQWHWLPLSVLLRDWCKLPLFLPLSPSVSLSTSHFSFSVIYLKACGLLYLLCALDAALSPPPQPCLGILCSVRLKKKKCGIIFLMLFIFLSLSSGCVVLMCDCISSIAAQTEQTPRFWYLTSEWVPQKYPLQLSSLPHFSISPLSSTLPTPLALSCHSAFLLRCHSVSLVAPALSGRMGRLIRQRKHTLAFRLVDLGPWSTLRKSQRLDDRRCGH